MKLNIAHLYPELMSLYGEYANLSALRWSLEHMGVEVEITPMTFEDRKDFSQADFIYMGSGTEGAQKAVLTDLTPHAEALKSAVEKGTMLFFTGNAMETLGERITDAEETVWPGLGFAEFRTTEREKRTCVDVVAHTHLWERPTVGFMNKCSATFGVSSPLFDRLSLGFGNGGEGSAEGYSSGRVIATHLTGPVLMKNPDFLRYLLWRIFVSQNWEPPGKIPLPPHMEEAYAVTLHELESR